MRILFLQKRLLIPPNTGGKIRTLNVLRHLARWHEVTYLCNLLPEEHPHVDAMRQLDVQLQTVPWREPPRRSFRFAASALTNLASRYPLNVDKDFDPRLRRRAAELIDSRSFDLLICDFVQMARNAVGFPLPSVLFQHNVEAEVFSRQADRRRGPMRWYLGLQAKRMRRFEAEAGRQFDGVIAVSRRDREWFESRYGWHHVSVIDTAVDTEYFRPAPRDPSPNPNVVFVGSMDWLPNIDGMTHFVHRIWPKVRQTVPDAELVVVGRNPPPAVRVLGKRPGVVITGGVPDIRPYLAEATVGIVPLYAGGGTRLKIFEMMASGRAVVSTSLGAEGLELHDGCELLIRDNDHEFADAVVALLKNEQQRGEFEQQGLNRVTKRHSARAVAQQFDQICRQVVDRTKETRPLRERKAVRKQ